ncbi:Outer membrane protein beta-barrel domain-containing protein [Mariniphaga anaerophila]|uniref:Outer membrane protein beta-barrel domain-containing protein n=1 Tax=Mariniphaga anaerophila TaxID=1484053 RepID=A0A1M5EI47_9BACT|nr:outer membrane beta-barrel protein [Mariniphaga anaerophila]SHF78836.1 Outer membrane protein beta-barrel domain-containing protein [Mariniphaga anaerophila]
MKQLISFVLCSILAMNLFAQSDTTKVKIAKKNVVTVVEDGKTTHVKVGNDRGVEVLTDDWGDTTHVRVGRRTFKVIDDGNGTYVKVDKEEKQKKWTGSFNPHWAGLEFGMNMYRQTDYSLYNHFGPLVPEDFMDLNYGKSITVNLNFAEWAFKNEAKTFGLVTGLGLSFMDLTFDQPITITKAGGEGIIMPVSLDPDGLKKTKLSISYLTAPLLLEVKTPLRMGSSRLYLAGGVIGGLNIGSHTKYKYRKDKEKARSNFNLNQFKYDLTGRIGFGDFCIFVNYGMTPLFKSDRGPELVPVTFGFSFPNI